MKLIAIEEHFVTPAIRAAWAASALGNEGTDGLGRGEIESRLDDLGETRLSLMDETGINVQVLSVTTPSLHNLEPEESVTIARHTNDMLAATIARHPARFEGFATLPTAAPVEAADELRRCVEQLGFKGTMLCGRTRDRNMDHPELRPVFRAAADLKVPVFIHPQVPQRAVREAYYAGFGEPVDTAFATFGLGWHYESGIQFVRMVLAGVFDELPELQVVLGHWGEVVLFYLERLQALERVTRLQRPVTDYFRHNLYITGSGMWSNTYLQRAVDIVGAERLLFSQDYPYQYRPGRQARAFLENTPLSPEHRELLAHGNWERLTTRPR